MVAHTNKTQNEDGSDLGDEELVTLHTVGFHEHGQPELLIRKLPHKYLQRAAGLLTYLRCERPLTDPLATDATVCVNELRVRAVHLEGTDLQESNTHLVVAVRGYYCLKKSDGPVALIELVVEKDLQGITSVKLKELTVLRRDAKDARYFHSKQRLR